MYLDIHFKLLRVIPYAAHHGILVISKFRQWPENVFPYTRIVILQRHKDSLLRVKNKIYLHDFVFFYAFDVVFVFALRHHFVFEAVGLTASNVNCISLIKFIR